MNQNLIFLNFLNFFENRDLTRLAPEKWEYLGIGTMDFGSKTGFGNVIKFCLDRTNTNLWLDVKIFA